MHHWRGGDGVAGRFWKSESGICEPTGVRGEQREPDGQRGTVHRGHPASGPVKPKRGCAIELQMWPFTYSAPIFRSGPRDEQPFRRLCGGRRVRTPSDFLPGGPYWSQRKRWCSGSGDPTPAAKSGFHANGGIVPRSAATMFRNIDVHVSMPADFVYLLRCRTTLEVVRRWGGGHAIRRVEYRTNGDLAPR